MRRYLLIPAIVAVIAIISIADPVEQPALDLTKLKPVLKEYLKTKTGGIVSITHPDADIFIAIDTLGVDIKGGVINAYLYLLCQEYYPENDSLRNGAGVACPLALRITDNNGKYCIISHQVPRDGEIFASDFKTIFPENCRRKYRELTYSGRRYSDETRREAVAFYFPE
jgi:hypothetical protein